MSSQPSTSKSTASSGISCSIGSGNQESNVDVDLNNVPQGVSSASTFPADSGCRSLRVSARVIKKLKREELEKIETTNNSKKYPLSGMFKQLAWLAIANANSHFFRNCIKCFFS